MDAHSSVGSAGMDITDGGGGRRCLNENLYDILAFSEEPGWKTDSEKKVLST